MEAALRSRLLALELSDEVSWGLRPQGTGLPAFTLHKITTDRGYTVGGASGFHGETVQIDVWATKFTQAIAHRDAIIAALEQPESFGEVDFSASFLIAERQSAEDVAGVGAVTRISLDFVVWWQA